MDDLKVLMASHKGDIEAETWRLIEETYTRIAETLSAGSFDKTDMLKNFRVHSDLTKKAESEKLAAIKEEKNMKALCKELLNENNRLCAELGYRPRTVGMFEDYQAFKSAGSSSKK